MSRHGRTTRQVGQLRKVIHVFCEGPTETAYLKCLKPDYEKVVTFHFHQNTHSKELYEKAYLIMKNDKNSALSCGNADEFWFVFDIEPKHRSKFEAHQNYLEKIKSEVKNKNLKFRFLLTSGCMEYWFMLHFEKTAPPMDLKQKDVQIKSLEKVLSLKSYKKGDEKQLIPLMAKKETACDNGAWCLSRLDDLAKLDDLSKQGTLSKQEKERLKFFYESGVTFTTVHEAILFLEKLKKK